MFWRGLEIASNIGYQLSMFVYKELRFTLWGFCSILKINLYCWNRNVLFTTSLHKNQNTAIWKTPIYCAQEVLVLDRSHDMMSGRCSDGSQISVLDPRRRWSAKCFTCFIWFLNQHIHWIRYCYCCHYAGKETEAFGGEGTCVSSHDRWNRVDSLLSESRSVCLATKNITHIWVPVGCPYDRTGMLKLKCVIFKNDV